ncbi:MAG: hypothetical protein AAYR33_05360 [Acetobacteraceae bacterium]
MKHQLSPTSLPLSLPMRYDHGMKKSAEADDEAPPIRVMREG